MPTVRVYNLEGVETGTIELPASVFEETAKPELIYQVATVASARQRQPLAHTKTRGEVSGGGRKPWKQKGTGRARHGSIRSPLWRGGGVTFGPRSMDLALPTVPQKMAQKALRAVLSERVRDQALVVIENPELSKPATKQAGGALAKLKLAGKSLLFLSDAGLENLVLSFRNLPKVTSVRLENINILDLLSHTHILITKDGIVKLGKTLAKRTKAKA